MDRVSVVGLGKLGEPLAVCLASVGFRVLGVDIDGRKIENLNNGIVTTNEPGLQELLSASRERIEGTGDIKRAIDETDTTFLLINTPSDAQGRFSHRHLLSALRALGSHLAQSDKAYHLFIIGSTVMPGTCNELWNELEALCDRKRFGLCYCPELVALGDCVKGFLNPDMVIIGENLVKAGDYAETIYSQLAPAAPKLRMSLPEAEIFKVALNFFLTTKISFANTLAGICEHFEYTNVDNITDALGCDSRIAPAFLRGGLAFGGFCFPRDVAAFDALCRQDNDPIPHVLTWAVNEVNRGQHRRLYEKVCGTSHVAVLGLSFKPGTPEIEASPAVVLVESFLGDGSTVTVYDPLAMPNARKLWGDKVQYASSPYNAAAAAPVVVIATAWKGWKDLSPYDFQEDAVVLDCWRLLPWLANSGRVKYRAIGVG